MTIATAGTAEQSARTAELLISADSHTMEPHNLWTRALSSRFGDQAPSFPPPKVGEGFQAHPGGHDPNARLKEMQQDGVSAEVLYPTLGLSLFGLDDAALQEACFQTYNDWLIEYCQVAPDRLVGVPCISTYDIDHAVAELQRCKMAGLNGGLVWQAPHPDLPFSSDHYDKLWAAAQEMDAPISLHILTGHSYHKGGLSGGGLAAYRGAVNLKLLDAENALFDLIFAGALDRFPRLKLVNVETEIGWMPFLFQQWDYYFRRFRGVNPPANSETPSFYLERQIYATFFNDAVGARELSWWGQDQCMWSNDFPHPNSTWPNSRDVIARDLGHFPDDLRTKLVYGNVVKLYGMNISNLT